MKIFEFKIGDKHYKASGLTWDIAFKNFNTENNFNFTMKYVQLYNIITL